MMDMNRATQKVQEALQTAQAQALRLGHAEIDGEHLLLALCEQPDGLIPRLLKKVDVEVAAVVDGLNRDLQSRSKIGGPGADSSKLYASRRLSNLLLQAEAEAKQLKDEYVSVEHVFLAVVDEGDRTAAGRLLKKLNINRDKLLQVLTEIRGNQRVTSQDPEVTYEALEKYGRDLVEDRGGLVKSLPFIGEYSTTSIVEKILKRYTDK